jgi:hypothetical protein
MTAHPYSMPSGSDALSLGVLSVGRLKTKRPQRLPSATLRGLLLESALLAASCGMEADAVLIRTALIGLGIDRKQFAMAVALIRLQRGEHDACLLLLEQEVLASEPSHELARAVQSRIWQLLGLPKGKTQANVLLISSSDPAVRAMARAPL